MPDGRERADPSDEREPAADRQGGLVAASTAATAEQAEVLDEMVEAGLLVPSGIPGVLGRGAVFEDVRLRFEALVRDLGEEQGAERFAFPPVMPRRHLEEIGYLRSFPHLLGTIFSFDGDEDAAAAQEALAANHEDWSEYQQM